MSQLPVNTQASLADLKLTMDPANPGKHPLIVPAEKVIHTKPVPPPPKVKDTRLKRLLEGLRNELNIDLTPYMVDCQGITDALTIDGVVELVKQFKLSKREERRLISKIRYNKAFQKELGVFNAMVDTPLEPLPEPGEEEQLHKAYRAICETVGYRNAVTQVEQCTDGSPLSFEEKHIQIIEGDPYVEIDGLNYTMHHIDIPHWNLNIWVEEYNATKARIEAYKNLHLARFARRWACFKARMKKGEREPWASMIAFLDASVEKLKII